MSRPPRTLPLVRVDWIDAGTATDGWQPREKVTAEKVKPVFSTGILISSSKSRIVIATDYDPTEDYVNGGSVIPRGMIRKVTRIGTWRAAR